MCQAKYLLRAVSFVFALLVLLPACATRHSTVEVEHSTLTALGRRQLVLRHSERLAKLKFVGGELRSTDPRLARHWIQTQVIHVSRPFIDLTLSTDDESWHATYAVAERQSVPGHGRLETIKLWYGYELAHSLKLAVGQRWSFCFGPTGEFIDVLPAH